MPETVDFVLLLGIISAVFFFNERLSVLFRKWHIPSLVGFILIGLALGVIDSRTGLFREGDHAVMSFLSRTGLAVLMFYVGFDSSLGELRKQLKKASFIWVFNVAASGVAAFLVAHYLIGWAVIPSLFAGVALTATSVGISVTVWGEQNLLHSAPGRLLIDLAELDDLSSISLMVLLFSLVPLFREGTLGPGVVFLKIGMLIAKMALFGLIWALLLRFAVRRLLFNGKDPHNGLQKILRILVLSGLVTAFAAWLGFSLAIGGFMAGLMVGRFREDLNADAEVTVLYRILAPFFFIGIGLNLPLDFLGHGWGAGLWLLLAAVVGKFLGVMIPALGPMGGRRAFLVSLSMLPRAEIALVVMERGLRLGTWAVDQTAYGAMIMVSLLTCLFIPILVCVLLRRWHRSVES